MQEHRAFLGLGSNLGERVEHLRFGVARLHAARDVRVIAVSPIYESEAHLRPGAAPQSPYLNMAAAVRTRLDVRTLLALALRIEQARGRRRASGSPQWASRTLDIDVLVFDRLCFSGTGLSVPHPRLASRRFVLRPLCDVAPDLYVPAPFDEQVGALLAKCPDPGPVIRTSFEVSNAFSVSCS